MDLSRLKKDMDYIEVDRNAVAEFRAFGIRVNAEI
jgi:hypothetical protein